MKGTRTASTRRRFLREVSLVACFRLHSWRVSRLLVDDAAAEIENHDDPNWEKFPEVGAMLTQLAEREECLCVAVCPAQDAWASGVGMQGKNRFRAPKVAVATALAMHAGDDGEEVDLATFPAFAGFVQEARASREEARKVWDAELQTSSCAGPVHGGSGLLR